MMLQPPKKPLQFLRWFCREDYLEEIEGDLTEVFIRESETSQRKAKYKFAWRVLKYFRPEFIKSFRNHQPNAYDMYNNYFKIAWRNLNRHRFYNLVNVAGLAIGIAACLVIVLFITDELSYDTYNNKADRIYRINAEVKFGDNQFKMTYRPAPEAQTLIQDYPEVESAVRFRTSGSYLVRSADGTQNLKENHVAWTDSTFFRVFSVKVLEGNPLTALNDAGSIAISKKIAHKYFPGTSALGKEMVLDNKYHVKITAVYENIPVASHFHFDILVSMIGDWPIAQEAKSTSYMSENFNTYLLLREGADAKALEAKLPRYLEKYMGPEVAQALGYDFTMEKFIASGNKYELSLIPLKDIHLHSAVRGDFEPNGSIKNVYIFGTVAAFILIIACINFMNLSTARSSNRAKEVGVRKVMGSLRGHLVNQFMTESILITAISIALSLGIVYFLLPLFNTFSSKQLTLPVSSLNFYLILAGAAVLIGGLAGLYPSFFLSSFKPINVLKGNVSLGMKSGTVRSALVVFQFVISIFLIIGTIAVRSQFNYIQNKKLGFEKDQVIIIHDAYALRPNNVKAFKDEALRISSIESGTISGYVPVETDWAARSLSSFWKYGNQPTTDNMAQAQLWYVDHDYLKTFRMKIKKGRDFLQEYPSDQSAIILNETAVKRLGLVGDPIGQKLGMFDGPPDPMNMIDWTVVGVVEDFHFSSMKENISALGFCLGNSDGSVTFRFEAGKAKETIDNLERAWKKLAPGQPFQYSFLDQDFEAMYHSEQRLGGVFTLFAGLTIIIACMGLFALTSFTAEQRTREIGIRKVLGASASGIVLLLSKDFGKLILIAFVVSVPLSWYAVTKWMESYTYKTEIGLPVYLLAGFLAFVIAILTMSYQAIKAALVNPVKNLRSE